MNDEMKGQVRAALAYTRIVAEAVREAGPAGIPAGTLYAAGLSRWSFDQFNTLVGLLERAGLVARDGSHMLRWVGP